MTSQAARRRRPYRETRGALVRRVRKSGGVSNQVIYGVNTIRIYLYIALDIPFVATRDQKGRDALWSRPAVCGWVFVGDCKFKGEG